MINLLRDRRSIRKFEEREIEPEKVEQLVEVLLRSPSSRSINPWEFIVVKDNEIIRDLAGCKPHGAGFLAGAFMAVVVLGDTSRSDTCIEDCSIAAITVQYAAQSMGLGSCWCQVRLRDSAEGKSAEEFVRELLEIPDHYLVECIIGIGYPGEAKEGHARKSLEWGKVHHNKYGEQ